MKKIISLLLTCFLLLSCSSKPSNNKTPLSFERPEEPFSGVENKIWYSYKLLDFKNAVGLREEHSQGVNDFKVYYAPNSNTLQTRLYSVDWNCDVYSDNPWYNPPISHNNLIYNENGDDIYSTDTFKYLGDSPFFYLDYSNREKAPLISVIEDKFIHRSEKIFFMSKNNTMRSVSLVDLVRAIEFGVIFSYKEDQRENQSLALSYMKSEFYDPEVQEYLDSMYGIDKINQYYRIDKVAEYITSDNDAFYKLYEMSDEDFLWFRLTYHKISKNITADQWLHVFQSPLYKGSKSLEEIIETFKDFQSYHS